MSTWLLFSTSILRVQTTAQQAHHTIVFLLLQPQMSKYLLHPIYISIYIYIFIFQPSNRVVVTVLANRRSPAVVFLSARTGQARSNVQGLGGHVPTGLHRGRSGSAHVGGHTTGKTERAASPNVCVVPPPFPRVSSPPQTGENLANLKSSSSAIPVGSKQHQNAERGWLR